MLFFVCAVCLFRLVILLLRGYFSIFGSKKEKKKEKEKHFFKIKYEG